MTDSTFISSPGRFLLELIDVAYGRATLLRALPPWAPGLLIAAKLDSSISTREL